MTKVYACLIEGSINPKESAKSKALYAIENSKGDLTEEIGNVLGCDFSALCVYYGNSKKVKEFQYAEKEDVLPGDMAEDLDKVARKVGSVSFVLGNKALEKLLQMQQMKNTLER